MASRHRQRSRINRERATSAKKKEDHDHGGEDIGSGSDDGGKNSIKRQFARRREAARSGEFYTKAKRSLIKARAKPAAKSKETVEDVAILD